MRSDNSMLPVFLYSVSQNVGRRLGFIRRTSLEGEPGQKIAYSKESVQDGEGIANQVLSAFEGIGDDWSEQDKAGGRRGSIRTIHTYYLT